METLLPYHIVDQIYWYRWLFNIKKINTQYHDSYYTTDGVWPLPDTPSCKKCLFQYNSRDKWGNYANILKHNLKYCNKNGLNFNPLCYTVTGVLSKNY